VAGVLQVADYDSARTVQLSATGKSLSKQSWYLVPKIREVVEILTSSVWQIYEVHPELSFAALGGDRTGADSTHTACGLEQRAAELSRQFDWPVETIPIPAGMARDDVFDALALLWSAERIAAGHSTILGDPPMAIHF
jgi:predicted RNase H-like nuclease